jgi:DNA-binding Lrp family transcriptional regulator
VIFGVVEMARIPEDVRNGYYFEIFEQIRSNPTIASYEIGQNIGISRNTVHKYLKEMYAQGIIRGPYIEMKAASNYKEYIYLMNFENVRYVFDGLKGFPHVLYHAMTFGNWNTMIITDQPLDFTKLIGFQEMVHHDVKYTTDTPKPEYTTWKESLLGCRSAIKQFEPSIEHKNRRIAPFLPWGSNEWKLFDAFEDNIRKTVTPILREIKVRYETYTKWEKDLEQHCSIHTGFYPEGYQKYMHYHFLFSSSHEELIRSVFSCFPTTSVITELEDQLLVSAWVNHSDNIRAMLRHLHDMEAKGILQRFDHATVLDECSYKVSDIERKNVRNRRCQNEDCSQSASKRENQGRLSQILDQREYEANS